MEEDGRRWKKMIEDNRIISTTPEYIPTYVPYKPKNKKNQKS